MAVKRTPRLVTGEGIVVLGLDVSGAHYGAAMLKSLGPSSVRVKSLGAWVNKTNVKGVPGSEHLIKSLERIMCEYGLPDLAIIEGYAFHRRMGFNTVVRTVETGTLLRAMLIAHAVVHIECPPSNMKKFCTGSSKAEKHDVARALSKGWGLRDSREDAVDAYGLALVGLGLADGLLLTPVQAEALEKLK